MSIYPLKKVGKKKKDTISVRSSIVYPIIIMMIMSQKSISRTNSPIPDSVLPHASNLSLPQSTVPSPTSSSSSRSPSLKHLIINTQIPENRSPVASPINLQDQNRICQWYCCECGQTYGSIIYKQKSNYSTTSNSQYRANTAHSNSISNSNSTTTNSTTTNSNSNSEYNITEKLRYYSQFIYSHHETPAAAEPHESDPDEKYDSDDSILHTSLLDDNKSKIEEIILDPPTRFTCHRCNHMMCPYCLKVRIKDLDDDNR